MRIKIAKKLAEVAHSGQKDKTGQPYILHPLRVGDSLSSYGEVFQIVGYLHDTIEDTGISYQNILDNLGLEIADAVLSVTRLDPVYNYRLPKSHRVTEKEKYFDFVKRSKAHPIGRLVKIADIKDNMRPDRMAGLKPEEQGMIHRYEKALKILEEQ